MLHRLEQEVLRLERLPHYPCSGSRPDPCAYASWAFTRAYTWPNPGANPGRHHPRGDAGTHGLGHQPWQRKNESMLLSPPHTASVPRPRPRHTSHTSHTYTPNTFARVHFAHTPPLPPRPYLIRRPHLPPPQRLDLWHQTARPVNETFFDHYKQAGFTNVRVPVCWDTHTGTSAPYTIDPAFLDTVEEIVGWSLARGMVTVLNTHHEKWLDSPSAFAGKLPRLIAMWTQVRDLDRAAPAHPRCCSTCAPSRLCASSYTRTTRIPPHLCLYVLTLAHFVPALLSFARMADRRAVPAPRPGAPLRGL